MTNRKFKLYTTTTCPYCHAAVKLISENNMSYECHALDNKPELLQEVKSKHKWQTVPMVLEVTGGQEKFIGGYTDLREYLNKGKQVLRG